MEITDAGLKGSQSQLLDRARRQPFLPEGGSPEILTAEDPAVEQFPAALPMRARFVGLGFLRDEHEILDQDAIDRLRHDRHHVHIVGTDDDLRRREELV